MDAELKQYLDGKFTEVDARFTDLEARFTEVDARFTDLEARLREHVSIECEKVETRLLTEFHKWGSTSDIRTRQAITDTGLLGERMLVIEDRVSALERQRRPGQAN